MALLIRFEMILLNSREAIDANKPYEEASRFDSIKTSDLLRFSILFSALGSEKPLDLLY